MAVAYVLKRTGSQRPLPDVLLELPAYHLPNLRNLAIGLWQRVEIFLTPRRHDHPRLDGHSLGSEFLPRAAARSARAPRSNTASPVIWARALAVLFAPIGFNWQISIALVPGLAAREVAVGALGTVYALSATGNGYQRRADAVDRPVMEPADRAFAAGLVRVRAAMPFDLGYGEARNQFVAVSAPHGGVSVCDCLRGLLDHLSRRRRVHEQMIEVV